METTTWKEVRRRGGSLGATTEHEHLEWAESGGGTLSSPSWLLKETGGDAQTLFSPNWQASSNVP